MSPEKNHPFHIERMQDRYEASLPGNCADLMPSIFLRWVTAFLQLMAVASAEAVFGIEVPATPLLMLVGISVVGNIFVTHKYRLRRAPEIRVCLHLIFDMVQISMFLYYTGGIQNPFSIMLLTPVAMAAATLSIYALCPLLVLCIISFGVLVQVAHPIMWPEQTILSAQYTHAIWVALTFSAVFISFIVWRVALDGRRMHKALSDTQSILEERRHLSALGGLAAAAVHELGSPLSTIALVAKEIEEDIHPDDPLAEDIALLRTQSDKCKAILADLAKAPDKKAHIPPVRLDRAIMEIASALSEGGSHTQISINSTTASALPFIRKSPNIEYGIGNFLNNALSFAKAHVWVDVEADNDNISVRICDDGSGFAPSILQDIGQPYLSSRRTQNAHMGLGIFIAVGLLEAMGAHVDFANQGHGKGAIVHISWPRSSLEVPAMEG